MSRLAFRIFLAFLVTLIVTALAAIAVTSWVITARRNTMEAELLYAAEDAADALASGGLPALTDWTRKRTHSRQGVIDILVIDETGRDLLDRPLPLSSSTATSAEEEPWSADIPAVFLNLPQASPELISDEGDAFRLLAVPKRTGLAIWRDIPLPLMLLSLAITMLMSFLLARSITRPILVLQRTTEALAEGSLGTRVPQDTRARGDEIGRLARSLDVMASRLENLIQGQQQLLRDVSHEVRSPLTRIRLASGLLAQREPSAAPTVNRIDEEIARLDELIDKILDVSRLESGAVTWRREEIDFRSVLERVLADAEFEADQLGKTLTRRLAEDSLIVVGDRHWIQSAIENVVRNALRHTPQGAAIEVFLDRQENFARLIVLDSGLGIPEDERARLFQPFYRGAAASERSRSGNGLGLAIAARVVLEHLGLIEALNRRDTTGQVIGFEIRMLWPLKTTRIS